MKKIFIGLFIGIVLTNCEIRFKKAKAQEDKSYNDAGLYSYREEVKDSMKFGIWFVNYRTHYTGYNQFVINLTKEKLEVDLLLKQLKSYSK